MIRMLIFLIGLVMILLGVSSRFSIVPLPVDLKTIHVSFVAASYTLDVVLMVAGIFLVLVSYVFHKLAQ
ncbi:MAG TPA: hypothetical protein VMX58_02130 [Patescibacteria group bacterium]|nr:hypothetical protein [Patescibacteria group bacterium]